ncbi:MAG: ABC transporter permease, partial [Verrucomicrobiota bacterium]
MAKAANALLLSGTITRQDGAARANRIQVIGVNPGETIGARINHTRLPFLDFTNGQVWLNEALAGHLSAKRGDEVVIRIHKPSALSRDAVISPRDETSLAMRLTVGGVVPGSYGGNLSLLAGQTSPLNVFVSLPGLADAAGLAGRANLVLAQTPSFVGDTNSIRYKAGEWMFRHEWYRYPLGRVFLPSGPEVPASLATTFLNESLARSWTLADAELSVRAVAPETKLTGGEPAPAFAELTTRRIFLEPAVVTAALTNATTSGGPGSTPAVDPVSAAAGQSKGAGATAPSPVPILTYLVNTLSHGDELAPYSMVTAAGAPYTPTGLGDDEIVVNEWLAKDLGVKPGDTVALGYYRVDAGTQLVERTNNFRVHSIVPMHGLHADRSLMPEFPGLTKAESTRDWDAGFDLVHPIRDADEAYWKQWRGTPKAFITLAAGQKMWANRFGDLTAIRWFAGTNQVAALRDGVAAKIRANLDPADVGLRFTDVRTPALAAAEGGTGKEFGGLMIGFSFFLITSALLLTAMLFSFSLGQRASETGILLAIGWEPRRVRSLLFREGFMVATLGTALGVAGGILYAKGVLWGLSTLWRDAVNGAGLGFHITAATLATGVGSSLFVAAATLWLVLRQQAKRPTRELLSEGAAEPSPVGADPGARWPMRLAVGASIAAFGMTAAAGAARSSDPGMFFGAGALLLIAGLLW